MIFAAYTAGGPAPIATAFENISPHMDGSYFTGTAPPFSYPFNPYSAVIDLETMEVIAKDVSTSDYLSVQDIVAAVEGAN